MNKKIFNPEKYGMATCPSCTSHGFIQNPERQCCPKCGGFGYIIAEVEHDANPSNNEIISPPVIMGVT